MNPNETCFSMTGSSLRAIHKSLQDGIEYSRELLSQGAELYSYPRYKREADRIRQDIADMQDAMELIPKTALK